jgi:flagellin
LISLIQTAEGALNETHDILQRMRELAVQASNDTNTATDRSELQKEVNELIDEIDRIAKNTQFNEQNLLDGSFTGKKFHIGSNTGQDITLNINAMGSGAAATSLTAAQDTVAGVDSQDVLKNGDEVVAVKIGNDYYAPDQVEEDSGNPGNLKAKADAEKLEIANVYQMGGTSSGGGLGVGTLKVDNVTKESQGGIMTQEGASNAITTIQNAIELVSAERSKLGAYQNRLDHTINNLSTSSENLTAAESRIRDVDYALAA